MVQGIEGRYYTTRGRMFTLVLLMACSSDSVEELNQVEVDPIGFDDENPGGDQVFELDASANPNLVFTAWGIGNSEQHGTWSEYDVRVVRGGPDLTDLSIDFVVNTTSVVTGNTSMERHLRTDDFFDVPNFPTGMFVSRSITGDGPSYSVTGDLTLRGRTVSITWDALIEERGDALFSSAQMEFSRWDFGLYPPDETEPGGDGVDDRIVLDYSVTLKRTE